MKILHVIPSISLVRGGPSQAVIDIAKALCSQGIEAEILTTNDDGPNLLDVPLGQLVAYQQARVRFFPRFSPPIKPIREFAFSSQLTQWLWRHIKDYDLVHLHAIFSYTCTAAMAIARIQNVPYIVRPNGLLCNWSLQQSPLKKQIYLAAIERSNLNCSQSIEFTAAQEQQEVAALNIHAKNFVLPYGLSLPESILDARLRLRQKLQIEADEPIILFMSRLHPKKGLEYLIPALGKLKNSNFSFILAGNGSPEYEDKIENLLRVSGIEDRTHRTGFVRGEMKNLLLQGADIFALTSHSESFGLAVLEAIAAGLSIVTTPGVPLSTVVRQHQLGVITEVEIDKIEIAIQDCLDGLQNIQQTEARRDRAYQLIQQNYTWDCIAKNLIKIYKNVLQNSSSTLPSVLQ
jgi:glycosyltransferase involved in cell wall biosynthesis